MWKRPKNKNKILFLAKNKTSIALFACLADILKDCQTNKCIATLKIKKGYKVVVPKINKEQLFISNKKKG